MSFKGILFFTFLILLPLSLSAQYKLSGNMGFVKEGISRPDAISKKPADNWWAQDKGRHLIGSMITTIFIGKVTQQTLNYTKEKSQLIGGGITLTLGIVKEISDSRNPQNRFSVKDILADVAGITLGILLLGAT